MGRGKGAQDETGRSLSQSLLELLKTSMTREFTFVSIEVSSRQKDPWKEAQESSFCLAKKGKY